MQRVVSRQTSLKFDRLLLAGLQPADAAHAYCGLRNLGFGRDFALQSMDSFAQNALVGNARLPGSLVGERGGGAITMSLNVPGSRTVTPRRSFRENRKLITHKSRLYSSRIESTKDFTPQRLLECAVDVLRNFNEKVNNLRCRWGGGTGSHEFTTAAEKKLPLSAETVVRENAAPELAEVANGSSSGKPPGSEFEWRSALWEAEVSSAQELEAAFQRGRISLGTEGSDVPHFAVAEAEVEIRADERTEETAPAANSANSELERSQSGNGATTVQASEDASPVEIEEVDIGELWRRRSGAGSEPSLNVEQRPWSSREIVEPSARDIERDGGDPLIQEPAEQSAVAEPSSTAESEPRSSILNVEVEVVQPSGPEIERVDPEFNILEEAGQSLVGDPPPILGQQGRSIHGNGQLKNSQNYAPQVLDSGETQSPVEEQAAQYPASEQSAILERQFYGNEQLEIVECSEHEVERGDTESLLSEQAQTSIEEQAAWSDPVPSSILEESLLEELNSEKEIEYLVRREAQENSEEGIAFHRPLDFEHRTATPGDWNAAQPSTFGGQLVSGASGAVEKSGESESAIEEKTQQNGRSLEALSFDQDSQRAAPVESWEAAEVEGKDRFGGQISTGEGTVINEGTSTFPDQEHHSDDFGDPFRERDTDDARVASESQISTDFNTNSESSTDKNIEGMDNQDLHRDINRLRRSVSHHAYMYHTLDNPVISDAAYDALVNELDRLELQVLNSEQSDSISVGAEPSLEMLKVPHSIPMLSLASVQKEAEVLYWYHRLQQKLGSAHGSVGWVVEPKVDGLALSVRYENGKLKCAATRGDGIQGEDVTHNAQRVLGIPLTIPHQLPGTNNLLTWIEVRGEIFMSLKDFNELNASKMQSGLKPMANPRNAAAGSMRLLSSSGFSELRPLKFMAYSIADLSVSSVPAGEDLDDSVGKPKNQWEALQLLKFIGFAVNKDNHFFDTFDSALEYAKSWRTMRKNLEYEADGVVLKVNDLAAQASLGNTGGDPRWAIAWKFAATEAVSVLEGIELTVGRSGAIIPNARFQPVELGGAMISRASLHNFGHVKALGLCEGDHIIVQRAGDVIPQVVQVLEDLRLETAKPWSPPQECPSCGSWLTETSSGAMVFCNNPICGSRQSRQVAHFAKTLIPGLGSATLVQLEDELLVKDPADIYHLDKQVLSNVRGFGRLSATKLLNAIEESKQQDLWLFLVALGIPRVGMNTAKELAKTFGSLQALLKSDMVHLTAVPGIGTTTAACIFDWCQCKPNIELVHRLELAGCKINEDIDSETSVKSNNEEDSVVNGPSPAKAPGLINQSGVEPDGVESHPDKLIDYVEQPEDLMNIEDPQKVIEPNECGEESDLKKSDEALTEFTGLPTTSTTKLAGKIVVVTGDFGIMLRKDMRNLVIQHGGTLRTTVTSKTSFVLCGNKPGPSKISEATRRGIEILDWESFLNRIGQTSKSPA